MSIEKILADAFMLPESTVVDALELRAIPAWDSLSHMMLIAGLEEHYRIEFTGDEIADMETVGHIRLALQGHGAAV